MSAAASKFLERVEQLGLVEDDVLADLRRLVGDGKSAATPDYLAKKLIADGHLTQAQANKLLAAVAPPPEPAKAPEPAKSLDDELGLADLGDAEPAKPAPKPAAAAPSSAGAKSPARDKAPAAPTPSEADDIIILEEAPATPAPAPAAAKSAPAKPAAPKPAAPKPTPPKPAPAAGLVPIAEAPLTPLPPQPEAGLIPFDPVPTGSPGLVDPFGSGAMAGPMAGPMGGPPGAAPGPAVPPMKKVRAKTWDSPLMLLGGGTLVLLLFAGLILIYVLTRGNASEMFEAAESDYKAQSYVQAIAKYDKFLHNFPDDPNASLARVRRGLAELRSVVEGTRDLKEGLERAKAVIPTIENEERFADARPELAGILPDIGIGLAQQAKTAGKGPDAENLVKLTAEALELIRNPAYIPSTLRASQQQRLDEIDRTLDEARFTIEQEKVLVEALSKIEASANAGQTSEAFEIRRGLLKNFPAVEADARLKEIVGKISGKEQALVQVVAAEAAAVADDHPVPADVRRVIVSHRRGAAASGADGQTLFFLASGAVYGLDAPSGQVLWRRNVGFETRYHPLAVGGDSAAGALLTDAARQEIVRVEARTGTMLWRLVVGERFANPVIAGNRILLTTETGQLWEIDAATGKSARRVKFPQTLSVEAGPITALPTTYQVGGHSHVYALAADTLECREVFYLGHRAGTVAVPPVVALNHVFIAENAGPDYSLLHVLAANESGLGLRNPPEQEPIRMSGHVVSALVQAKNRVIAVTNLGEIRVVEVDPTNDKKPAKLVASLVKTSSKPQPSQTVVDGAQIWVGADRFVAYDIQASRGQINRRWIRHERETFVSPMQKIGKTVFHARRRQGSPGITIAAASLDTGDPIWQTDLAVPLTHVGFDAQRKQIVAVSGQGDLFRLTKESIDQGLLDKPIESAEVEGSASTYSFLTASPLAGGRMLLASDQDRGSLLVYDPSRMDDELLTSKADTNGAAVSALPEAFGGGALIPSEAGQVLLVDPVTGKSRALPFQPRLEPGFKVKWTRPVVYGTEQPEFVIADNRQKLYQVGLKDQPNVHLGGLGEADLPDSLVAPLAATIQSAFAVTRGAEGDVVHSFGLPGLTKGQELPLKGRVTQGPWSIENLVFLATDQEGLVCISSDQQIRWSSPLTAAPLAGPPVVDGESLLLTSRSGIVWRVGMADGMKGSSMNVGAPLTGSPTVLGTRLLIGGSDGALYALPALPTP